MMIDFIRGILAGKSPSGVVIDINGIGFSLAVPLSTYDILVQPGEEISLLTRLIHRDDTMELFGFATEFERGLFDNLIGVSGIGPKMAIKILSGMHAPDIAIAIRSRDYKLLTSIPGLGKKTAERLCIELESAISELPMPVSTGGMESTGSADAIDALESLGFPRGQAADAVRKVSEKQGDIPAGDLVREALNILNR